MRNGNLYHPDLTVFQYNLFILPMRNGNILAFDFLFRQPSLFILPMRNGNKNSNHSRTKFLQLFILPMRNVNYSLIFLHPYLGLPFYPTYEEWKLVDNPADIAGAVCLFILPMRNGNDRKVIENSSSS